MDPLTITAASGLRARMESLDMLANNLANAETAGYKADREFYGLYISADASAAIGAGGRSPSTLPVIERQWTDFSQGTLRVTSNPCDVAISGNGFFAVDGPSGPLYTRNGSFRMSQAGNLVTREGYPLRLTGGAALQLNPSQPFEIAQDGSVAQGGQTLGRLAVVDFNDRSVLAKNGENYFVCPDPAVRPAAAAAEVHQGKLENSNIATAESAVRLIGVMRQFEALHKAISISADMNRRVVQEVARVSS